MKHLTIKKTTPEGVAGYKLQSLIGTTLLVSALLITVPALATEFHTYEGKEVIREGEGGAKRSVGGIDFWTEGTPPYRFKVIGYITDRRLKTGLIGMIAMPKLEGSVAKVALRNGGDAVIQLSADVETLGFVDNNRIAMEGTATTTGNTTQFRASGSSNGIVAPVQKQNSRYVVIKYLKETGSNAVATPASPQAKGSLSESKAE